MNLIEQKDCIENRLNLFGEPGLFLVRKEGSEQEEPVSINKYYNIDFVLKVNNSRPYLMGFTPNGNYGKVNKAGKEISRTIKDAEDYVAALYMDLDLDKSGFTNKEEYKQYILDEIELGNMKIHYLVETGNGFHAYSLIKKEDRYQVGKLLKGGKFKKLEEHQIKLFKGGDVSSISYAKVLRMPFSYYWKNFPIQNNGDFQCKLSKITQENGKYLITEINSADQINLDNMDLLTLSGIQNMLGSIDDMDKDVTLKGEISTKYNGNVNDVNSISIVDVIDRLKDYKRNYEGHDYVFKVYGGTHIGYYKDGSDELIKTDGYTINIEQNYVNCFSDAEHPIAERPRGAVYPFLFHYFKGDRTQMNKFLKQEYGIEVDNLRNDTDDVVETFLTYSTDSGTFSFCSDGVRCSNKIIKRLFSRGFNIIGTYKSCDTQQGETELPITNYLLKFADEDRDDTATIQPVFDRKKFNSMYGMSLNLATKASEFELIDMFDGLDNLVRKKQLPYYDYRYLNGYYSDMYLIGDMAYDKDGNEISDLKERKIIINTPTVEQFNSSSEITIKEFAEKFRQLYSDRESMLTFISFLTLLVGHKFWVSSLQKYLPQVLVPGLFLSGGTKNGKTTAISLCKRGFGLSVDSKKLSIKSVTPQPLNKECCDDWLIHLEEWTGKINEEKETIIRNVLNKTTVARGVISGFDIYYKYKSAVIIDGETTPSADSVVNRSIFIPYYRKDRIGTEEQIFSFGDLNYRKDFIKKLYLINVDNVRNDYKRNLDELLQYGVKDRIAKNYVFLLCVNEWFDVYDKQDLLLAIFENLELDKTMEESSYDLSGLLNELIIDNHITPILTAIENGYALIIPLTKTLCNQFKVDILGLGLKYKDRIKIQGTNLIILYSPDDTDKDNIEIYNNLALLKSYYKLDNSYDISPSLSCEYINS